jgi:hypothetical protein
MRSPSPKNNQRKMDWRCDSSSRALALQVQRAELHPLPPIKKRMIFKNLKDGL